MTTTLQTFTLLSPEIALVLTAVAVFLVGAFTRFRAGWLVAAMGIAAAMGFAGGQPASEMLRSAAGPAVIDDFSVFVRWSVLGLGGLLALVLAGDVFPAAVSRGHAVWRGGTCEEAGCFLLLLAGLSIVGSSTDLVLLFAGLELVSVPTYILLGLKRTDAHGQEAALKYFFLSLVASALFLYAVVCLYGIGGSTSLAVIGERLRSPSTAATSMALLPAALGMAIAGVAFRLAAVPMQFYAPDVYEGTSPGNAALLSTLPKVAGVVLLLRLIGLAVPGPVQAAAVGDAAFAYASLFWQLAAVLGAVTMTVGNVMALVQRNLRRLLACSSIAHAGYLLVGVAATAALATGDGPAAGGHATISAAAAAPAGAGATLFYLATYALATIGLFAAVTYLGHRWPEWSSGDGPRPPREEITTVDDLDGLSGTNPVAAFSITVFLLSLAGIPPLPGFWGKLSLATAALQAGGSESLAIAGRRFAFVALAVILVLNAAIAAAYYLRIISAIYFRTTRRGVQADGGLSAGFAMLACLTLLGAAALQPRGLYTAAMRAGLAVPGGAAAPTSGPAPGRALVGGGRTP